MYYVLLLSVYILRTSIILHCTLQMKELHTEEMQRLTSSQNKYQERLQTEKEQVTFIIHTLNYLHTVLKTHNHCAILTRSAKIQHNSAFFKFIICNTTSHNRLIKQSLTINAAINTHVLNPYDHRKYITVCVM